MSLLDRGRDRGVLERWRRRTARAGELAMRREELLRIYNRGEISRPELHRRMHRELELLPGNGRAVGRAVEWIGRLLEGLGLWIQRQGAELRWRRVRAWKGWGS